MTTRQLDELDPRGDLIGHRVLGCPWCRRSGSCAERGTSRFPRAQSGALPVRPPVRTGGLARVRRLRASRRRPQNHREIRPAITASYVAAGSAIAAVETKWAKQVAGLVCEHCGPRAAVGVERVNAGAALALRDEGFQLSDAQAPLERARAVKSAEELKCVRASLRATEVAVARPRAALRPVLSENELWSVLHQGVIALGGEEPELLSTFPFEATLLDEPV